MKTALVHDHLAQDGGAEKVLKIFSEMFSEAPIYTLLYEEKNVNKYFLGRKIETSIIQKLPWGVKRYQWYLVLMPLAVEFFDLSPYDLVLSDSSSFAKGVITSPHSTHICYCHTPTRYLWSDTHQYINELKFNKLMKKIISLSLSRLRFWDYAASARVDFFIANSKTVQQRIQKYYRRSSTVIYPPVETEKFKIKENDSDSNLSQEKYFLAGCRLVPYKRIDIVIEAFKKLGDEYKLKIFGDGPDLKRLKKIVGEAKNIEFLGRVSDEYRAELYAYSQAFINPQEEDFGITVVEAMASGRPVIAYGRGGATETVIAGKTGLFFQEQTESAIYETIREFKASNFDPQIIRTQAEKFSVAKFKDNIKRYIAWAKEGGKGDFLVPGNE